MSGIVDPALLERCARLARPEDLRDLLEDVRTATAGLEPEDARLALESRDSARRAGAFLCGAAHRWPIDPETALRALSARSSELLTAAALYVAVCLPDAAELHERLLLGKDPWSPPESEPNARFHLIEAMRLSADERFVPLLHAMLEGGYHFDNRLKVLQVLEELLGGKIDPEQKDLYLRSISVDLGEDVLVISADARYGGDSNCIHCKFFPCVVNRRYAMGIEDCRLWNQTDPAGFRSILDRKGWGRSEVETPRETSPEQMLCTARDLIDKGVPSHAIPRLCSLLVETDFGSTWTTVAWVNLARAFSACHEPALAFIALREASRCPGLVATSHGVEREELERFVDDPGRLARELPKERSHRLDLRAIGYESHGLFTRAFDCYAEQCIDQEGGHVDSWFGMGECHRKLGEHHLSILSLRLGAHRSWEIGLRQKCLAEIDAVRALGATATDPGLALERRAADRAAPTPPGLCS